MPNLASVFVSTTRYPELLAEKSRRARDVAVASGLFDVPKVLEVDVGLGTVAFERVRGLVTLGRTPGVGRRDTADACRALGRALATIHNELHLPTAMMRPLPPPWPATRDSVCLHGDLTAANVCWNPQTRRIVIVDWATAPLIGETFTIGPRFFDVAWFAAQLFYGIPLRRQWFSRPGTVASEFLNEYLAHAQLGQEENGSTSCFEAMDSLLPRIVGMRVQAKPALLRPIHRVVLEHRCRQWRAWLGHQQPTRTGPHLSTTL